MKRPVIWLVLGIVFLVLMASYLQEILAVLTFVVIIAVIVLFIKRSAKRPPTR